MSRSNPSGQHSSRPGHPSSSQQAQRAAHPPSQATMQQAAQVNFILFIFIFATITFVKGRDRLDMVVKLKVQYCGEKLKDSFDTNCDVFTVYNF